MLTIWRKYSARVAVLSSGFSGLHRSIRTFKLNRINELTTLDKRFTWDGSFGLHSYLSRARSMIPEGRIYNIKLPMNRLKASAFRPRFYLLVNLLSFMTVILSVLLNDRAC